MNCHPSKRKILTISLSGVMIVSLLSGCSAPNPTGVQGTPGETAPPNTQENTQSNTLPQEAPILEIGQFYDYAGKSKLGAEYQLTLYVAEAEVQAVLQVKGVTLLPLKGTLENNQLALYANGIQQGSSPEFSGRILTVDDVEGVFNVAIDQMDKEPAGLKLISMGTGTRGQRYSNMGSDDDALVNAFAKNLQKAVLTGDAKTFAAAVAYPVTVDLAGKTTQIQNEAAFVKNYEKIMNPAMKKVLSSCYTSELFSRTEGAMLGSDTFNIWIGLVVKGDQTELKIIGINNGEK